MFTYPVMVPQALPAAYENQALVGSEKRINRREKTLKRRKVNNEKNRPWGQGCDGPVPSCRSSSGF